MLEILIRRWTSYLRLMPGLRQSHGTPQSFVRFLLCFQGVLEPIRLLWHPLVQRIELVPVRQLLAAGKALEAEGDFFCRGRQKPWNFWKKKCSYALFFFQKMWMDQYVHKFVVLLRDYLIAFAHGINFLPIRTVDGVRINLIAFAHGVVALLAAPAEIFLGGAVGLFRKDLCPKCGRMRSVFFFHNEKLVHWNLPKT
jgi:hypothetical protein